jgi:nicotinamide-nucleotide amidase
MKTIRGAELICVGTELLLGEIVNTNAAFLSKELAALGIPVYRHTVVGDNPARLTAALEAAYGREDVCVDTVILCGGLGPTCDDLTKETVVDYFGRETYLHVPTLEQIESYFRAIGRPMPEGNRKQAVMPVGGIVFPNRYGTAPALAIEDEETNRTAILLPGPPNELIPLMREQVEPYLRTRSETVLVSRNLHIMDVGESMVEEKLRHLMQSENPTLAPYAKEGEVRLRITARAADEATARSLCDRMEQTIRATDIGVHIYGVDVETMEQAVASALLKAGKTLACAESCTGGYIAKRLTDLAGVSEIFLGGCVTYANSAKQTLLGVSPETLAAHGAVSRETALEMARGVRTVLGADIGISTTGIAGPGGGTPQKPVGTVWIAVSTAEGESAKLLSMSSNRSREFIRYAAASQALAQVLEVL